MGKMDNYEFYDVSDIVLKIAEHDFYSPITKHIQSSDSRCAVKGYEKRFFVKVDKRTGESQKVPTMRKSSYVKVDDYIQIYYYNKHVQHQKVKNRKEGTYKMIKGGKVKHSVVGPAHVSSDDNNSEDYKESYYLFGKQFSKEEWETHPFVVEAKLIALGL